MNDQSKQSDKNTEYAYHHSFLLRLWRTEEPAASDWRASLEVPGTAKRLGFTSLEQLFTFLMDLSEGSGNMPAPDDAESL